MDQINTVNNPVNNPAVSENIPSDNNLVNAPSVNTPSPYKPSPMRKLPLYVGLVGLVLAVLVTSVKLGQNTEQRSHASSVASNLSLKYTAPDMVSVFLAADKEIAGIDVVVKYNPQQVAIPASTLSSGPSFITTGGITSDTEGKFSFSALPRDIGIKSGLVGTFKVSSKIDGPAEVELQLLAGNGNTSVIEKATNNNIYPGTTSIKFTLASP